MKCMTAHDVDKMFTQVNIQKWDVITNERN